MFRWWLFCLAWLALACSAHAESLTPLHGVDLPALTTAQPLVGMAVIDGQTVAVAAGQAWRLDDARKRWLALAWPATVPNEVALIQDGTRAYLLWTAQGHTAVAELHPRGDRLDAAALPALPARLIDARGAVSADALFVAGKDADGKARAWQANPADPRTGWTEVPAWPGSEPALSLATQGPNLFVAVGRESGQHLLRWSAAKGWTDATTVPGKLLPAAPRALGQAHLLYLVDTPQGVQPMTFHTITGSWATLPGAAPAADAVTAAWPDGFAWAQRDGGGYAVHAAQLQSGKLLLKWLDWVVILVYLAAMFGIGLYFYLREKRNNTANFFVGGRSIPFWAAGVSLYAANTSSISFIAIPAKAFESNWTYLTNNLIAVLGLAFVAVWIVPLLRRLDLMSVFSYLETRFHPAIRMLASALCIVTQIGSRMSVILFLPALAIATITGISVTLSVVLMGVFTIVYTAMGGMKAVIWTDFVQVLVKMGGALFVIGFIVWHLHGGLSQFMATATANHKMHLLDFRFDLTKATVWGFLFLVLFDVVLTFPKDQVLMQRTLSTESDKEAGRSIWMFAAIMIPGGFVFYLIGTALFVFYKDNPERLNPLLPIDATFPLFIAAELPMGVTGLIIAGIFAAAMATLSGIMNSVATLISVDFYEKLVKQPSPKKSVLIAELMTVAVGLVGIATALLLSRFDIHSLFDVSIELAGLLGGGFAGAYTLGMFTRRANSPGVAIGIGSSIVLTLIAWSFHLVHPYFYLAISILLCIVIGYLASLLFPAPTRSLEGLTIYSRRTDHPA
ncbi:sodium:solute symporter [Dyella marensis]|uniref:Transporter, SSS family n=1 Tax=Dyella marensis TaxID=500610 RepID=A0A1I2JP55_9GAMM|nr:MULTISPECIES: sodium:solute symporter [Dyella]SFF55908.1 transporter, SSS family [Dyella marensis]